MATKYFNKSGFNRAAQRHQDLCRFAFGEVKAYGIDVHSVREAGTQGV